MALLPLHNAVSSSFSFANSFSPPFAKLATASASFSSCFYSSIAKATSATIKSSCHAQQRPEPAMAHNRMGASPLCLQQHRHCPRIMYAAALSGDDAVTAIKPAVSSPPFNVLITGSTKGVGYALAREFLAAGDSVIICSRSDERVQTTLQDLTKEYGKHQVLGKSCDVRDSNSIRKLIAFAKSTLGYVDIWINNAGSNAYTFKPLVETSDAAINEIVETNMIGVMICCREAIKMMVEQPRGGHIFNMDGAGADGGATPRFAAYGATKRSLTQFTKTLQAELRMQRVQNVILHSLSPGMVTTDLLMSGSDTEQARFFINVLAEPPDVVAKYLVPRIRCIPGDPKGKSTYIRFLTGFKAYSRLIARILFRARKNRYVNED